MEKHLQNLKKEIDQLLKEFLEKKQREAKKLSPVYGDLVNQVTRIILGGGKRLRPILVYYGYKSIKNPIKELTREQLLSFSICAELFHSACLVHDDIMDSATIRHGQPTVNSFFTRQYGQKTAEGLAILAGDLILVWADEILTKFKKQFVLPIQTLEIYDKLREEVYFGQTLDLIQTGPVGRLVGSRFSAASKNDSSKTDQLGRPPPALPVILQTYTYKTAKYSFERPLQLGAALAGADDKILDLLSNYAIPVGIAFQIQDDILGVFGKEIGKDVGGDIKEGKETILINYARTKISNRPRPNLLPEGEGMPDTLSFKRGKGEVLTKFNSIFGNKKVSSKDLAWVKNLIKQTGAQKYCQDLAEGYIKQAKISLADSTISQKSKDFLFWLADFVATRKT